MVYRGRSDRRTRALGILAIGLISVLIVPNTPTTPVAAATAAVSVDATRSIGTSVTQLSTQFVWPVGLGPQLSSRLGAMGYQLVRINADSDAVNPPVIPTGLTRGDWNFAPLDQLVNTIVASGARPVLDIGYPPDWMWNCSPQFPVVRDLSFVEFGDYMARLVSYYNKGSFVAEDGRTITNPQGTANHITYWELWNEPDLDSVACLYQGGVYKPKGGQKLTQAQDVTMWNTVSAKMLAVDPTLKLVGPSAANPVAGYTPEYIPAFMAGVVRKPDIVSFHAYGGYAGDETDQALFDGLQWLQDGLAQVQGWAGGRPVWITEFGMSSSNADAPSRPLKGFGMAWAASAFRRFALAGLGAIYQFQFLHPGGPQLSLLDPDTSQPLPAYWLDYYLTRYFPPGSTLLQASSTLPGVEVLAARVPGSTSVRVLLVNRQVNGPSVVGGPGLPATVDLNIANLGGVTSVTQRMLDSATPLPDGPRLVALSGGSHVSVSFSGYGAAFLEFGGSGVPGTTCSSSVGPGIPPPARVDSGVPEFHASWYGQSGYMSLCAGTTATATIAFYNTGSRGWVAGSMGEVAYLGTWAPEPGQDRASILGGDGTAGSPATGWPRYNRPGVQPAEWVGPNQIAWFQFNVLAPAVPGTYRLALRPLIEGADWMEDYGVFWVITVLNADGTPPRLP